MKWQPAPIIKLYEALGSLADGRVELHGNEAKVYSSSGNKYYDVVYDQEKQAITSNDNASFWVGYLGYPSICFLLASGLVHYNPALAMHLKGFAWKDINQKFKNDFSWTQQYIDRQVAERYKLDMEWFHGQLQKLLDEINTLELERLPSAKKPPSGY